jgi:hypothetical protein
MFMSTPNPLTSILQQIADIQSMERGKLSIIKEGASGPFYKLQAREKGKNLTRYVPREQAPAVQEAIEGYQRFEALTQEYAHQVIANTRASLAASLKKSLPAGNPPRSRGRNPGPDWPVPVSNPDRNGGG